MTEEIPDAALAFFILGALRAACQSTNFPIWVDRIEDNIDKDGQIETFTLVTRSGLRFRTTVEFEGRSNHEPASTS